ncbi:MAG: hypothetical protein ACE15E_00985 [Acidobacteriota bacterium]
MVFDASMLSIGSVRQHFFDDLILESVENIERAVHAPERHGADPVIRPDHPWEGIFECTVSAVAVLRDPRDGLFKCWYLNEFPNPATIARASRKHKRHFLEDSASLQMTICYAQSCDGVSWEKPALGLRKHNGLDTNIILGGQGYGSVYNMTPIIDPVEPDPGRRFKAIYTLLPEDGSGMQDVAAYSGDGVHWTTFPELPSFGKHGNRLDDVHKLFFDPYGRIFIMTSRHYEMYAGALNLNNPRVGGFAPPYYPHDYHRRNKRRIWQSESADFIHWTEPYLVLSPQDGFDGLDHCFYGMPQFDLGDVRVGFLNVFQYVENRLTVQLVYSRNGKKWIRFNKGQTWFDRGPEQAWDSVMVAIENPPIPVGDEWFIYYGGASCHHDWWLVGMAENLDVPEARDINLARYAIGLLRMRQEGIVSLRAGEVRPGIIITRPLLSSGTELVLNARCGSRGFIQAEVVDLADQVLPGFSRQDCDVFTGDSINHKTSWRGRTSIPAVHGRATYPHPEKERFRKFRFFLQDAEIYALQLI